MSDALRARAAARGGVVTTADLRASGVERATLQRMVRSGRWVRLRRGVFAESVLLAAGEQSPAVRRLHVAAELAGSPHAVASHESALAVYGLPDVRLPAHAPWFGHTGFDDRLRLTAPKKLHGSGDPRRVHWHWAGLPRGHTRTVRGIRVTSPARTVVDIARSRPYAEALVVADAALRLEPPYRCRAADLARVLHDCRTWPGVARAAAVVAAATALAESPLETLNRILFSWARLPRPRLQHVLVDAEDRFVARVDFYFEEQATVVEADGALKYDDPRSLFREKLREDRVRDLGLAVARAYWRLTLHSPHEQVARVVRAFGRSGRAA